MTHAVGLLAVFGYGVITLALVADLVSPAVSELARPLIAILVFACTGLLSAGFDALRAPGWTMFMGGAVIVANIIVIIVTVHLWSQGDDGGESGPGQEGDEHGGGGTHLCRPDAPQRGGGGSDPSWWPEFERDLVFYVAKREREKRQPAVLPASTRSSSRCPRSGSRGVIR